MLNKLALFLEFLSLASFCLCVFAPIWVYAIVMVLLVLEAFTMCARYMVLLSSVKDIKYYVLSQQRRIMGYTIIAYGSWSVLSLCAMYYLNINLESYFGYKPNMYNFADPLILLLTSTKLLLFGLTMAVIHFVIVLRAYFGVPFDLPPIASVFGHVVRKLKHISRV